MKSNSSRLVFCLCLTSFMMLAHASQAEGIQMLPPTDFSGSACSFAENTYGVLQWDGKSSIKCVPGFYGLSSGNVGIGAPNPLELLQVGEGFLLRKNRHAPGGQLQIFDTESPSYLSIGNINTGSVISAGILNSGAIGATAAVKFSGAAGGNLFLNPYGGNVGVGTTAPQAKLDVAGTIRSSTKSNIYPVKLAVLTTLHGNCVTNAIQDGDTSKGFKSACVSACNRFCQRTHGYSGGTITEYGGSDQTAMCLCSP